MNTSGLLSSPTPRERAARIAANPKKYFFKAAVSGDIFLLKQLLDQGSCNWASKDEYGATALHHTAFQGHLSCLKLLLETATNVDVLDADECTPLHNAAFSGHVPCAEALLARGADVRRGDVDKATAVHKAAHNGHVPMLKLLLSRGADSSVPDREGLSPLHCAVFRNAVDAAAALLDASAAVDARDAEGAAPLHISAAEGALACVSLLLARGASPLVTDRQQMLPLHFAAANGQLECLHELIAAVPVQVREASVAARSQGGNTALHHAAAHGSVHCLSVLLRAGAELEATNARGSTALHVAASKRHVSAVRYLLQKGSAALRTDQSGRTPRDLAAASSRVRALFDAHLASAPAPSSAAAISATPPRLVVPNGATAAAATPTVSSPHHQETATDRHQHAKKLRKEAEKKHKPRNNVPHTFDSPVSAQAAAAAASAKHHRRTSSNDVAATQVAPRPSDDGDSSNAGTPSGSHVESKSASGRGTITRSNSAPLKEHTALALASPAGSTPAVGSVAATAPSSSPAASSGQSASADSSSSNVSSVGSPEPLSADKRKQSGSLPRKTGYKIDRYGFVLKAKEAETIQKVLDPATAHEYEAPALEEFDEAIKWAKLMGQYRTKEVSSEALSKMKKRCARGIPERVRGEAWKLLANAHVGRDSQLWAALLPRTSAADDEQIKRDLARTFPEHSLFRDKTGTGQQQLYLVLKAFSVHHPAVGYCQGMGFVAALLLIYLDAEDAFWLLSRLCDERSRYGLFGLFRAGMPELAGRLDTLSKLLEVHVPRVAAHLRALAVDPTMYAPQWFITVFLYNHVPFPVVLRLWDLYFVYGYEIVFFFALTLFKTYEDKLLELQSFEEVLRLLKWDTDALRQQALVMAPDQLVAATLQCRKKLKSRFIALEKAQREAAAGGGSKEKARDSRTSSLTGPYAASPDSKGL